MKQLNKAILPSLQNSRLPLVFPEEKIFQLPEKVLQFGTGVLLRGLPDYFIDKANRQGIFNGRIVMVKSTDSPGADAFTSQGGLYTQVVRGMEKGRQVEEYIINSSISRTFSAQTEWPQILSYAHSPEMQVILSNTTEVGIQFTAEDIRQSPPQSFPGKLTAFLYERYQFFGGSPESGLVIVPCELVVDNGNKLKEIVGKLATLNQLEEGFMEWIHAHTTFCNSLVDRIVPGKPEEKAAAQLLQELGYQDELLIMSEVYRLWAIQGDERVKEVLSFYKADPGMIIEADITPYRERKLRLLNGTHTISVGLGYLYGLDTVGECMNDTYLSRFISQVMQQEIVPAVPVDEKSARIFADEVLDRFRNPFIVHPLINITLQYTSKMNMRNVQTIVNYYQKFNQAPALISLGFAAYLLFMKAVKQENGKYIGERKGVPYPIQDDKAAYFFEAWQPVQSQDASSVSEFVSKVLADITLWGTNLNELPGFRQAIAEKLLAILNEGVKEVVQEQIQ
ncbi:tagaturonate reductase [Rhodocytophaga rosea]|uniref:Tagaturonate reductase n=1 Tax=Rhodocytophaga rosea TaxID=2704465 RepID=A0A6C0GQ06_9BACT|nr:tagaturonate reductase [Rhodocytophaga rosea]QHT70146.1 tagaturonate reductase [Rhodocytophaga rosea]